jgi:hypothetical protein
LPEIVIPSADTLWVSLSRSSYLFAVLLPESFRGGCSFGVERSDLSRDSILLILVIRGEDNAIQLEDVAVKVSMRDVAAQDRNR